MRARHRGDAGSPDGPPAAGADPEYGVALERVPGLIPYLRALPKSVA